MLGSSHTEPTGNQNLTSAFKQILIKTSGRVNTFILLDGANIEFSIGYGDFDLKTAVRETPFGEWKPSGHSRRWRRRL
jgi:hypothetical protein